MAAGSSHVIAVVNAALEIYDKDGALLVGPTTFTTFFSALGGGPCVSFPFDPNVLYDEEADRYIIAVGGNLPPAKNDKSHLWNDIPFVYDTKLDRWLKIADPLPPAAVYNDTGICIIDHTIYVAAGEGPKGSHFNHFLIGKIQPF